MLSDGTSESTVIKGIQVGHEVMSNIKVFVELGCDLVTGGLCCKWHSKVAELKGSMNPVLLSWGLCFCCKKFTSCLKHKLLWFIAAPDFANISSAVKCKANYVLIAGLRRAVSWQPRVQSYKDAMITAFQKYENTFAAHPKGAFLMGEKCGGFSRVCTGMLLKWLIA